MSEKMGEMLTLMQRAEKMEYVNEEIAFNLYLQLFQEHEPQVSKPYESAIRLLEKRDRLQEALDLSHRAIDLINRNQMTAGLDRFTELAARIEKKMREQGITPIKKVKSSTNLKSVLIIVGIVVLLFSVTLIATPFGNVFISFDEKQGILNGNADGFINRSQKYKDYPITKKMIAYAVNNIERDEEVVDATLVVQDSTIGLAIVTKTNESKKGRALVVEILHFLGAAACAEYKDLEVPGKTTYGGIYAHYDLIVTVGTGVSESSFFLRGTMNAGTNKINYKEDAPKDKYNGDKETPK